MAQKSIKVTSSTMAKTRTGKKSLHVTTGPVRLPQNVRGQNKRGHGKPQQ